MELSFGLTRQHWIMISVGMGIFTAEVLSLTIDPTIAWFVGGCVIGTIPMSSDSPRLSKRAVVWAAPLVGLVTAITHLAIERMI